MKRLIPFLLAALFAGCASVLGPTQTTPDVNYYSIPGDATGSLWVAGQQVRLGPLPVYEIPEIVLDLPARGVDASKYNDILKFSHAVNVHIAHVAVRTGGSQIEQAIDMNNLCQNIGIDRAELDEGHENVLTIKGGCTDIHVGVLLITPGSGNCDIELGGISAQSNNPTTGVSFNANRTDGKPVRLRIINATTPSYTGNVTTTW